TTRYAVSLYRDDGDITAWCDCPTCEGQAAICRHIWAALLAAEAKGYLQGDGKPLQSISLLEDEDEDDWDDLDEESEDEPDRLSSFPRPRDRPKTQPRTRPQQHRPSWKATLASLRSNMEQQVATHHPGLSAGEQIVYVVDVAATLAGSALA